MTVFGGDTIYAADLNALEALLPKTTTKAIATDRTNNTMTADPELTGIALAVGTYEIDLVLMFTLPGAVTPKLRTQWGFSGTWNTPNRACFGPGASAVAGRSDAETVQVGAYGSGTDAVYSASVSAGFSSVREVSRLVVVTVAGNLSLVWAQNVTNASATSVKPGTSFTVRKIA